MKNIPPPHSILEHNEGASEEASAADIDRRAEEIAEIEGHTAGKADRRKARQELNGDLLPSAADEDAGSSASLSRDPSDPIAQHGRQIPNHEDTSEENDVEKLVTEGVEEAQHDQMIAARKRNSS